MTNLKVLTSNQSTDQVYSALIYSSSAKHTGKKFERKKQGSVTYSAGYISGFK